MNDIKVDLNTHDLVIEDGDLILLNSEAEVSRQTLKINLLFFQGEWFLDLDYGIPYIQRILTKGATKQIIDTIIKNAIRRSYQIQSIETFTSEIKGEEYIVSQFTGVTVDGSIVSITNQVLI